MTCITDNYFAFSQVCRVAEAQLILDLVGSYLHFGIFPCLFLGLALPGARCLLVWLWQKHTEANYRRTNTSEASAHYFP